MENNTSKSYLDLKPLIVNELTQAKELLKQLDQSQLGAGAGAGAVAGAGAGAGNLLLDKILSSFETSISMLNGIKSEAAACNKPRPTGSTEYSPCSVITSRRRNCGSDLIGKLSKKRKTAQKWTEQVRVCGQSGRQGSLEDDGYVWRKYGQKDILGASHPRGYYRCTHRKAQGCSALKQVQRSDEDPSMFNVTYRGRHTCVQAVQAVHLLPWQLQNRPDQHDQTTRIESQETVMNFQTGCHDITEDSSTRVVPNSYSFSFPSASIPIPCIEKESDNNSNNNSNSNNSSSNIFSSMTPENHFMASSFSSPSTSESNSISPYRVNSSFGEGQSIQTSEVDLSEFTSAFDPTDLYLDFDFLDSISFDM